MGFEFSRYRTAVFSALAVLASAAMIHYAVDKIDSAVYVNTGEADMSSRIIVLDCGHGGMDGGCSTADGITEKGINLKIMLSVRDMCRLYGYDTAVTRDRDISIHDSGVTGVRNQKVSDMENRLELFNKFPDAVCLSIHQNTYTDPKFSGAQMFYSATNPESERFASILQNKFVQNLQPENMRETKLCGKELYLCYFCNNPAVMAECGFLSNPEEASKLTNEAYQQQVAYTLFSGLNEFLS
ncbi:MAG: N-acetylmuramoyl-L-alanine amidase [Oscillospiraceae bacterium]|nr:N-acetylmuramoyl-L-alanine amidase [Oscillospiraceae bacterium]